MKAVAVIGYKNSGKTRVAVSLIKGLVERGFRVAAVKHVHEELKLPPTDSTKFYEARAERVIAVSPRAHESVARGELKLWEVLAELRSYDYVIIEGFKKDFPGAKVVAARNLEEAMELYDPLVIAYSGLMAESAELRTSSLKAPIIDCVKNRDELVEIVAKRSFEPPPGLNCGFCRYGSCRELALAIAGGKGSIEECVVLSSSVKLKVDGADVPLNPFVQNVLANVVLGVIRSLKGVNPEPARVEIKIFKRKTQLAK